MDSTTLIAILTAVATAVLSGFGSWVAVKIAVAKLEVRMQTAGDTIERHDLTLRQLNDDALIHDMELESALSALKLPRVRRQRVRD
jgi:hypothetical protein